MSQLSFMQKLLDGVAVEWIEIGELISPQRGRRLVKSQLEEFGSYAVYQNSMKPLGYYHASNAQAGSTFVIVAGAAGEIGFSDVAFWAADDVYYFPDANTVNSKYLYHFLLTKRHEISSQVRRASVPRLSIAAVEKLEIPIPCPDNPKKSLEIQAEIVRILDAFTAVTAELTAELSTRKKQYNYYRDQLLSFEEGEVEWKTLGEISDIYDSLHQTPRYAESGLSMIRVTDIKGGYVNLDETLKVNDEVFLAFTKKYIPKKYDLVMSRVGSYGNVGVIPVDNSACMGQNTVVIHPLINSKYLFHILVSNIGQSFIERNVDGGSQKTLSLKSIKAIPIPLVSVEEQERIASILDKFDALTNSITEGLPREIALRQQQYEYYRELLLSFPKPPLTPP